MKNISYKIYAFFVALLLISVLSVWFFNSSSHTQHKIGTEVPNIEISNFTLYMLNEVACESIIEGERALRFAAHEELYDVMLRQISNDFIEHISAPFVLSKDKIYTFSQGANYTRADGLSFRTNMGEYHYNKRIFNGKNGFVLSNDTIEAVGSEIYYDLNNAILRATDISADIKMEQS